MKKAPAKIATLDLNLSAYQHLNDNLPELELQGNRVVFNFTANDLFHKLSSLYNSNSPVNVLDYVNAQRQLRAMMLSKKMQR